MRTIGNLTISGSLNTSGSIRATTFIGVVSSSAQLSTEISGAFTSTSASLALRTSTLEQFSSSLDTTFATDSELSSTSASLATDIQNNDTRLSTIEGKTLVSSSAQISYTDITDIPANIISSSAQLSTEISGAFTSTSASLASRTTTLENAGYTTYSDSDTLTYINSIGVVSSSAQLSNATIPGNLTVGGILTAQEFHTEFVSASIIYESGSTQFGNTVDDMHTFLGTLSATTIQNVLSSSAQIDYDSIPNRVTNNNQLTNGAGYTTCTGDITGVTAGTGLSGGGTSGAVTVSHADTSTLTGAQGTSGIASITVDALGHVTAVTTATYCTTDTNTTYTANDMLTCIKTVDGAGSGLDADTLDGNQASAFYLATNPSGYTTCTGDITGVTAGTCITGGGTSGAVTINHADTSTLSGTYGTAGIKSITVDGLGHVTAVTTDTYLTSDDIFVMQFLVVAGGGGGGGAKVSADNGGGGGGAGGYYAAEELFFGGSMTISIGAGGTGGISTSSPTSGTNGTNSSLTYSGKTYTTVGGGGGGAVSTAGLSGGSGGGAGSADDGLADSGGTGTTDQGNDGGGTRASSTDDSGAGGGGAGAVGESVTGPNGGDGGIGLQWLNSTYYAGGGGGGYDESVPSSGGLGGGGNGGASTAGAAGTANTGGGGGGGGNTKNSTDTPGGNGGSGVVIVRYEGSQKLTGGTVSSSGGYTYHTFTSSGTLS